MQVRENEAPAQGETPVLLFPCYIAGQWVELYNQKENGIFPYRIDSKPATREQVETLFGGSFIPRRRPPIADLNSEQLADTANLHFDESESEQETEPESERKDEHEPAGGGNHRAGLFRVLPLNAWLQEASTQPIPAMLFDEFWFEDELCLLFAETNQGKSVAAVQVGDSIASGKPSRGFKLEGPPRLVLYFDFELSAKQVERRYSENYKNHYTFSENFIRVEVDSAATLPPGKDFGTYVLECVEEVIISTGGRVVILDNITFLNANTEASKDAGPLMIGLQEIKRRYGLSMLIIGHTPKRDPSRPLTRNDLQGSSRLAQLADSMFAIGASAKDSGLKYFKQIKVRAVPYSYDSDNVIVCQLHQPTNFLHFDFIGYATEGEHLKTVTDEEKNTFSEQVFRLKNQGLTQAEIAAQLKTSQPKVSRILSKTKT